MTSIIRVKNLFKLKGEIAKYIKFHSRILRLILRENHPIHATTRRVFDQKLPGGRRVSSSKVLQTPLRKPNAPTTTERRKWKAQLKCLSEWSQTGPRSK